ncbi:cupin domain-containing protein [Paraburkholderia sp. CNPSo 3157]|uniref:Cupin domain-containing protein n=1 Tax=Paraburkholderia franconis TaxID=2654983 RepID=A0A7X1NC51_9BURK|nr:cupin domain-containing protein [Paraburkholderia franconis]
MHCDRPNPPPPMRSLADMGTGTIHFRLPRGVPLPVGLSCTIVSFEPSARTHWHIHPLGQRLFVTAGCGWMQCEGEPIVAMHPGDMVCIARNRKHWHGASPWTSVRLIALHKEHDSKCVDWLKPVTDEQYYARPSLDI